MSQHTAGRLSLGGCVLVLLLSADFFLPMRQLGSYFHIAMNGMAASDRIFRLLDMPEPPAGGRPVPADTAIRCRICVSAMSRGGRSCEGWTWICPGAGLWPWWARAAAARAPWPPC